jgi:hypothetical protein
MIASSNRVARSAGQTFPLVPLSAAARARREARSAPRRDVPDMMNLPSLNAFLEAKARKPSLIVETIFPNMIDH